MCSRQEMSLSTPPPPPTSSMQIFFPGHFVFYHWQALRRHGRSNGDISSSSSAESACVAWFTKNAATFSWLAAAAVNAAAILTLESYDSHFPSAQNGQTDACILLYGNALACGACHRRSPFIGCCCCCPVSISPHLRGAGSSIGFGIV